MVEALGGLGLKVCRPNIRGRCIVFRATEPSGRTSDIFRAREFRHECGFFKLPPEKPPKTCVLKRAQDHRKLNGSTQRERRYFAAECGPDFFGDTRALEAPFFDPGSKVHTKKATVLLQNVAPTPWAHRDPGWFRAATHNVFCCRMWPRPLWAHTSTRGSIFRSGVKHVGFKALLTMYILLSTVLSI